MLTENNVFVKHKKDFEILLNIFVFFIISRLLMLIICILYSAISGKYVHFVNAINIWDAGWYASIVENGYSLMPNMNDQANWAFSPLYPMIVRLFKYILPFNTNVVFVLVSNMCICIGTFFGAKYFSLRTGKTNYVMFVFLTLCGPYSFYFSSGYAEAMFFMFLAMSLYYINKKSYIYAGLCSALATLTRSYGVFIVFIMVAYIFQDNFNKLSLKNLIECIKKIFYNSNYLLGILLCPMGLFIYMLYMYFYIGDIWAFYRITIFGWSGLPSRFNLLSANMNELYLSLLLLVMFCLVFYLIYHKFYGEGVIGLIICFTHLSGVYNIARHSLSHIFPIVAICLILEKNKQLQPLFGCFFLIYEAVLIYLWYSINIVMI